MSQARDQTSLQPQRYFGVYRGTVLKNLPTGDCEVDISNVGNTGMVAEVVQLGGGFNSAAGFRQYPKVGAQCIIAFEQGDIRAPKIIGYFDSKQTGTVGLKPGDISLRTDNGAGLALEESNNSARLFNSEGYGVFAGKNEFRLESRLYSLISNPEYTKIKLNGNVTQFFSSDGQVLETMQKYTIVDTKHNHKSTERVDEVTGDWNLKSQNNLKMNASQINGVASEEINFTARNDFAIMSKTFSSTQDDDIFFGSTVGDIQIAALAGDIIMAAGAVATADDGISTHTAQITIETDGTIEIDNHTTNTKHTIEGKITETAELGKTEDYGPSGLDTKSKGQVKLDSKLTIDITATLSITIEAKASMTIKAAISVDIESSATMSIKAGVSLSINASVALTMNTAIFSLTAPLMTLTPSLPIFGVKVITILGPQYIIPFP